MPMTRSVFIQSAERSHVADESRAFSFCFQLPFVALVSFSTAEFLPSSLTCSIQKRAGLRITPVSYQNYRPKRKYTRRKATSRSTSKRRQTLATFLKSQLSEDSTVIDLTQAREQMCQSQSITEEQFDASLQRALTSGTVIQLISPKTKLPVLTTKALYHAELQIVEFIDQRAALSPIALMTQEDFESAIQRIETRQRFKFDAIQHQVLYDFFVIGHQTLLVGGYAGSGKTTLMSAVRQLLKVCHIRETEVLGTALAGKAVQRLQTASQINSQTLHSAFQIRPGRRGKAKAIRALRRIKVFVLDEASMISSDLMTQTLLRIPTSVRMLIVGDPAQLSPIGAGQPFADLLEGQALPAYQLQTTHRSGSDNTLTTAAFKIRNLEIPETSAAAGEAMRFVPCDSESQMVTQLVERCLELAVQDTSIFDTQLMSFTNVSSIGTTNLNQKLQEALNPDVGQASVRLPKNAGTASRPKTPSHVLEIRVGDKIIHETNTILRGFDLKKFKPTMKLSEGKRVKLSNGLLGEVIHVKDSEIFVKFPELEMIVRYTPAAARAAIELAWCLTVHKCQGSEFQRILMPILDTRSHRRIASNSALYTAVTRAKLSAELVGDKLFFNELCSTAGARVSSHYGPTERRTILQSLLTSEAIAQRISKPIFEVQPTAIPRYSTARRISRL
jgi:exodeoxyribonuclease V alpha subunit